MKKHTLFLILFFISHSNLFCQILNLDSTFDNEGIALLGSDTARSYSFWSTIQADQKIISVGKLNSDIVIYRTNPDGTPDSTFGINGMTITTDGVAFACALQSGGKIVVSGFRVSNDKLFIARYLPTGVIDSTFSNDGMFIKQFFSSDYSAISLIIQPNQKIVAGCRRGNYGFTTGFLIFRLNQSGTLDSTFGDNGVKIIDYGPVIDSPEMHAMINQPDNKILIAGEYNHEFVVARLDADGTLDPGFGNGGKLILSSIDPGFYQWGNTIGLQSSGKIILGLCDEAGQYLFLRLNSNGVLDSTFANNGLFNMTIENTIYFHDELSSIIVTPNDKIIGAGYMYPNTTSVIDSGDIEIICLTKDGILDSTFNGNGIVKTDIGCLFDRSNTILIQSDGKILVSATCGSLFRYINRFALVRYKADFDVGVLDFSNHKNLFLVYPNPVRSDVIIKYSLSNRENISINLYDLTGRLVKTFVSNLTKDSGEHTELFSFDNTISDGNYIISILNKSNIISAIMVSVVH